jgi:multicomponent Na+:H+ antiporter subunit E
MPTRVPAGGSSARDAGRVAWPAAVRAVGLLGFWLLLTGANTADLPAGIPAVGAATWASLRLLPPGARRARVVALAGIALRIARQSLAAGVDVARRALSPRLPLRPGFVSHPLRFPPGPARDAFCTLTSLLPGSVPSGTDANGALWVHCLDLDQPVAAQLAADEARLARALGERVDG